MMPFDVRLYLRLIAWSLRDARTPRQVGRAVFLALLCPAIVLFGSLGMVLDWVFFPGLRTTRIETPVIVTGHPGSGTSLMVKLLSRDPRYACMVTWEMIFPSITQKTLVLWATAFDRSYLGGLLAKRVTAWEDRVFATGRKTRAMGLTMPEEDGFLLAASFLSAQAGVFFPYPRELDRLFYLDQRTPRQRGRAMRFYQRCVRRHLYLHGGNESGVIFLSKNPAMVGALVSLREIFPDARFVVMMRDPCETIPSLLEGVEHALRLLGLDGAELEHALDLRTQQSLHAYQYPFEALDDLPPERCAFVRYEELVESPSATIEALYQQLGLAQSDDFVAALRAEDGRPDAHRREPMGSQGEPETPRAELRAALPVAFARFGWPAEQASFAKPTRTSGTVERIRGRSRPRV